MRIIKERRVQLGLSQEKLAEAVELSVDYISAIENDKKKPSLKRLEKIAEALGVSANSLMDGANTERQLCPFSHTGDKELQIDTLEGVTKDIFQTVLGLPLEDQIKILTYACDLKKLYDFTKGVKSKGIATSTAHT